MCKRHKSIRHFNGSNGKKRPNHSGTLEWMGERGWLARWTVKDLSGRKFRVSRMIRKSEEVPDVEAARKVLNDWTRENAYDNTELALLRIKAQLEGIQAEKRKQLDAQPCLELDDLWDAFLSTRAGRKPSEQTKRMYECQIGVFVRWMKDNFPEAKEIRSVTKPMARKFSEHLIAKHSANTHNKYVTLLKSMWSAIMAAEEDMVDEGATKNPVLKARLSMNPWSSIEKEEVVTNTRRELTLDEIRLLCSSVSGQMRMLFCVSLETGLRLRDSVLLDHSSVDMVRGIIKIRPHKVERTMAKKNVWVTIPILPDLYAMLSKIPEEDRHGYVMPELAEEFLHSPSLFSWKLSKVFKSCGIETNTVGEHGRRIVRCGFHSLRHTFVSLASQTVPLSTIQAIVGHASPAMTRHYLHLAPETVKSQMANFPRLLPCP